MVYPVYMTEDLLELTLVGAGEPLLRLQKRLGAPRSNSA